MSNENIQPITEAESNPYEIRLDSNIVISTNIDKNAGFSGTITLNNTYGEIVTIIANGEQIFEGTNESTKIIEINILPDNLLGIIYSRMNNGVDISTSKLQTLANDIEPNGGRSLMIKALDNGWSVEINGISNN